MNEVCQVVKETQLGIGTVGDDILLCIIVREKVGVPNSLVKIFSLIFCFMWVWKFVFHIQGTWRVF